MRDNCLAFIICDPRFALRLCKYFGLFFRLDCFLGRLSALLSPVSKLLLLERRLAP